MTSEISSVSMSSSGNVPRRSLQSSFDNAHCHESSKSSPSQSNDITDGSETSSPKAQEVMNYLNKHDLAQNLNNTVNAAVRSQTEDPFGYMANSFLSISKPATISKLVGRQVFDTHCIPTVAVDVFALVRGTEKLIASGIAPSLSHLMPDKGVCALRDNDESEYGGKGVTNAICNVNNELSDAVEGMSLTHLLAIERKLIERDGSVCKTRLGFNAVLASSFAIAHAGAAAEDQQLFEYFATNLHEQQNTPGEPRVMPIPICTLMRCVNSSENTASTAMFEFVLIPPSRHRDITTRTHIQRIIRIYHELQTILSTTHKACKTHAMNISDALITPANLSTDEALCLIEKAIENAELHLDLDMHIGIICNAMSFYDEDTKNYRLSAEQEITIEDLASFYLDLMTKHPLSLRYFEEPFARCDSAMNISLTENNDILCISYEGSQQNIFDVCEFGTFTESIDAMKKYKDSCESALIVHTSTCRCGVDTNILVDFSVAIRATFIRVGGVFRGENINQLNRLLHISDMIQRWGTLRESVNDV